MAIATVKGVDLVAHCMRFHDEGWGYIYGASGQIWTQAMQNRATDEQTKRWGQQWVGRHVIDCSGVWWLAMKELGSWMYHGSNSMWNKYKVCGGALRNGKRADGGELKLGMAIYTGNDADGRNHVGIYIGNGNVLEAGGCQYGVIITPVTKSKWTWWAEQKYVDYSEGGDVPVGKPTLRKGSAGSYVTLLQTKLVQLGYDLSPYGADGKFGAKTESAVKQFQIDKGLNADGVVGAATWAALDSGSVEKFTVTIHGLSRSVADQIVGKFGGSMTKEGESV